MPCLIFDINRLKICQQKVALNETLCVLSVMQPIMTIQNGLSKIPERNRKVFALTDLRALLPELNEGAFKSVVTRLEGRGGIVRICRGIYVLPDCDLRGSELLGSVAARLRAGQFNYLSLETVLSDAGIISQIPVNRIMLMSSGRSNVISCGAYGSIEFVHTRKTAEKLAAELSYDAKHQLWRASIPLALRDMKDTRRDTGLVNEEIANEFI